MHDLVRRLTPMCRSITGDGVRDTLRTIQEYVPLAITEVPTGTPAFDWTVPREWNVRKAYIRGPGGEKVLDLEDSSLHIISYSDPVETRLSLAELKRHVITLPDRPDWIPYRTSYFKSTWGFCMSHRALAALPDGEYEVCIDSTQRNGHLTYGECYIPGQSAEEVLVHTHVCHPAMCNDNLSGIAVAVFLARTLMAARANYYSYRLVLLPGMIGPIVWLALNEKRLDRIRHGLVLTCLGDTGSFTYKKSRAGNADIDRAVAQALKDAGGEYQLRNFSPCGYDERQYCSPGINLPVGRLTRTPNGEYPEYHTSADNIDFVSPAALEGSLDLCTSIVDILERNRRYINMYPKCEPQLGIRGLYRTQGGTSQVAAEEARLWVLNFSDGEHRLLDIAERSGLPFPLIALAARELVDHGLLQAGERS
jgi:aminopeptidase-like protein